jgi:putative peptide zinc metalloprotease protein
MKITGEKPLSAIDRPLSLRLRPDLVAAPVVMSGATTWVVKDPTTLEHFQFTAEEYALLEMLRRPVSLHEMQKAFARRFPPQTITPSAIWDFIRRLHEEGLLLSDSAGQGHELLVRRRRQTWRRWSLAWMQLLAIRFRGLDPDALVTAVHDRCRWLFSPLAFIAATTLVLYAGALVVGDFRQFQSRLPGLNALTDPRNIVWMMLVIGGVKVLHELGHALTCKHFGGEVRELGFMLLAFSPCLYCDVSDCWRLPNKWRRISVSAAGMIVELLLAAVATIVWWHARPGVVQLIALDVMLVATVGTLLVNGNPLLRYDGYYILSDLVETPNLWQRSRDVLGKFAARWFLRTAPEDDPLVPARHRAWLAAYALASKFYVSLVCMAIVWGLVVLLHPLHLQNLAYGVGLVMVGGALVGPVAGAGRLLRHPSRRTELKTGRLALVASLGLAALVAVLAWPVNYYVHAPLVLMPADSARVYATLDGTLVSALPAGRIVKAGDQIAALENPTVQLELARLEGQQRLLQLRAEHLDRLRSLDPEAGDKLPAARAALADVNRRLDERRHDATRLSLSAPVDGVVIPVPRAPAADDAADKLPTWSGAILDEANRGALVTAGTLLCLVGDPNQITAVLLADDADAPRLRPAQAVRLLLDQLPGQVLAGQVVEVARHDADAELDSEQGDLTMLFAGLVPPGDSRPRYQVLVRFDAPQQALVLGGRGSAKIAAERVTLGRRMLRYLGQTFRLPM